MLGQFIARAAADNILSKSFIDGYKGRVDCEYARYGVFQTLCVLSCVLLRVWRGCVCFTRAALDRAAVLLRMSRWTGLRIDSLWGSGGGQRPVNQLIKEARTHAHSPAALQNLKRLGDFTAHYASTQANSNGLHNHCCCRLTSCWRSTCYQVTPWKPSAVWENWKCHIFIMSLFTR